MKYNVYKLRIYEVAVCLLIWLAVSVFLAFFFYRSLLAALILFLFFPVFLRFVKKYLQRKRDWKMTLEFKEMLRILSINIQAGNSPENAFINTYREMKDLFGVRSIMAKECEIIVRGLENNIVIENLVSSLGERSSNEEIAEFAEIFSIAKRSGGNLKEIITDSTEMIDSKIEIKREYRILISSKKFEHRIMCCVPFIILIYIGLTSPGYFDMFYGNLTGVAIMSVCLAVYLGAFIWGEKIADIKV